MREPFRITVGRVILCLWAAALPRVLAAEDRLDKQFYNDYLDSLPNERLQQTALLEKNLLRVVVRSIRSEDSLDGPAYTKNLQTSALKYEVVATDSAFARGIFKELPYLKPTKFMWIVSTGPYMIFVSFLVDPRLFITGEFQTRVVKKSKGKTGHE